MIEIEQVREIVARASDDDECAKEFTEAVDTGLSPLLPIGHLTANKALFIFKGRAQSARAAGVDVHGIDRTLTRLEGRAPEETVLLSHWSTENRTFTAFISDADKSFIGCVSLPRRFPDGDVDWSTGAAVR
ncbi:MAG: hypothetical protein ABI779_00955 [Acidobacteriota bacterium]